MNAIIMLLSLLIQLPSPPQGVDNPPGTAYSVPPTGTVLRAGPGADFPGVLTLDGATVVRIGAPRGTYREVFVAQGFDVYMHGDYMKVSLADATATVTGDHVNMRLRPSTDGLMPVNTLGAGTGPLVFLGRSGDWVHVLAPLAVPLYAPADTLPASEAGDAAPHWRTLYARREQQRVAGLEGLRATDPEWQAQARVSEDVNELARVDVAGLDAAAISARRARLDELQKQATWDDTRANIDQLRLELEAHALKPSAAATHVASATPAAAPAQVLPEAAQRNVEALKQTEGLDVTLLTRESKTLALGWKYSGRGDAVTRKGSVHREGIDSAPVFTLHSTDGEILKLTAPHEVATLEALVGRQVELSGRRLFLTPVNGPVLVIDKVVSYTP